MKKKPLMLMILDGWGINTHENQVNAIKNAAPAEYLKILSKYPNTELEASGEAVGLPDGQMGNSEVGHLNIGAGRVIYQPLVKISKDIKTGKFFENEELKKAFSDAQKNDKAIHFMGLVSPGGVHSHLEHIFGLLEMAKQYNLTKVYLHAFLDGRDTAPNSAIEYLQEVENKMEELSVGKIATLCGRYYAMDRDKNYDRTKIAYDNMNLGDGENYFSFKEALEKSYANGITDEFVKPTVLEKNGLVHAGDVLINFNFRPDRARQITRAFNDKDFDFFNRNLKPTTVYCMRQYDSTIDAPVVYKDDEIINTFGEILSKKGLTQLRTAETEKYAHVTFFFNGGVEEQYKGEERILVPSPKVATYDLKPEMSAFEVTDKVEDALNSGKFDVVILNFANPDMVGHTGVLEAAEKAVKAIDICVKRIVNTILSLNGVLLITADHGNVELMVDPETKIPFTAHTTNLVPFIYISNDIEGVKLKKGKLADIAPTMLNILGIEKPREMTGESLLLK